LFSILFTAALVLTVVASLQALSVDVERFRSAYPILLFNLGLIIVLTMYLVSRVWSGLFTWRARRATPLLHRRFVLIFSLVALVPAVLVGAFSTSMISRNVNDLYGEDVKETLNLSYDFLNNYLKQELVNLTPQLTAIRHFLESNRVRFEDRISYTALLQRFALGLDVDSIHVIDRQGRVYARALGGNTPDPELKIPDSFVLDYIAEQNLPGIQTRDEDDYLVAVTRLDGYKDMFVLAGRSLKPGLGVLSSISDIESAEDNIRSYNERQSEYQRIFLLVFIETALLILIAAVWLGLLLADRIIDPIDKLVNAAEKVRGGDLTARVTVKESWGEISDLGSAFNRMTRQLGSQREDLVREHDLSERRRKFSEAVLSGVRAGVIGLTEEGYITLVNKSAEILTGKSGDDIVGYPLEQILPEFAPAFKKARESILGHTEDQVDFETERGVLHFDLRVSGYESGDADTGWVITFDDMTRLVAAQRHSAWREVARRIAHEIKNPLTPILLSAERLRRKYLNIITAEKEVFENCTGTIIRQVGNLEQMVSEFSTFARTPEPEFEGHDLNTLIKGVLISQRVVYPDVKFLHEDIRHKARGLICRPVVLADERLLGQALTNIYKNAAEAITRRLDTGEAGTLGGVVTTSLQVNGDLVDIVITDNGPGWPVPDTDRLLEPYVTTRDAGTGLGLAIVKRIIEDHGGRVSLSYAEDSALGACVTISLPALERPDKNQIKTDTLMQQDTLYEA